MKGSSYRFFYKHSKQQVAADLSITATIDIKEFKNQLSTIIEAMSSDLVYRKISNLFEFVCIFLSKLGKAFLLVCCVYLTSSRMKFMI